MSDLPGWARPHVPAAERVVWWDRPSSWGLVPIALSTLAALAYVLWNPRMGPWEPSGGGAAVTASGLLALAGVGSKFVQDLARIRFTAYVATEERLYAVTSFFSASVRSVPLERVASVSVAQGLVGRLFSLWTARVQVQNERELRIPAIHDGARLLDEVRAAQLRGANAEWLTRGD